ncbi:MAG: methionyl-tRNA formyltransferase [Deltaproteobacteria bacterium]|nr:methionyl-tRNA formyltransferase [Deltaproteobacteria bacterium]
MRLVFFGTPEFAVPTLERLLAGPHSVELVISQPDRRRGRGRKTSPSPVSEVALREEIPLLRPESVNSEEVLEAFRATEADLGVVVAFGQFIGKPLREGTRLGYLINGHGSILPEYRGAAPIQRAILDGKTETGISVMRLEREMDAGDSALILRTPILSEENTAELSERLAVLCADAILQGLASIDKSEVTWTPQDSSQVTYAEKIMKEDGELHWEESAQTLSCRIRATAPKPGAVTLLDGDPLRILKAHVDDAPCDLPPGTVQVRDDGPLRIATGQGWIVPETLQRAGGKALERETFLRGHSIAHGTVLVAPRAKPATPAA